MLPTSHLAQRNPDSAEMTPSLRLGPGALVKSAVQEQGLTERYLAPASEPVRADGLATVVYDVTMLAGAFTEFIAAASRLEASYGELQHQVADLGLELAERNAALNASLAENERMRLALQQIVDSMPCGVLVLDSCGALSMINPEGMRLLDLLPGEAQSLASIAWHGGIDLSAFAGDAAIADGEQERSVATASGKRWLEVRNHRLHPAPAAHASFHAPSEQALPRAAHAQTILILRDVTAHKQAEQQREQGRKATALAEIAAMLAHEIRNPLASMELFAGLLAQSERVTGGPELVWVSHMRAGIRSLSGTVNNVLNLHGASFPALATICLTSSIESSVEFVRPIAEQSGVTLLFHSDAPQARVLGSESAIQQLVLNLISNAVRHTARGGTIRVAVRLVPTSSDRSNPDPTNSGVSGRVQIEFADTGSGIRSEQLGEIFRAGFSGSGTTSGLGLAVCKQIVRQHDGHISVSSRLAAGTTFLVELPTL